MSDPQRPTTTIANVRVVLVGLLIGVPLGLLFTRMMSRAGIAIGFGIGIGICVALALDLERQSRRNR